MQNGLLTVTFQVSIYNQMEIRLMDMILPVEKCISKDNLQNS